MLLADPSSRLCAAVRGWYSPVDTRWLLTALLQTTRATVYWPWDVAPKAKPEEIKRANDSLMERWG